MKRIGILTLYYKTYNYGAQLQAFALQRAIEKLGYDCEQIRFAWSCEQTVENYYNSSINQATFAEFSNSIKHSNRIYTTQDIRDCIEDYDALVVGSDQVWGVEKSMPLINLPIMTLSFASNDLLKIAYAASFGSTEPAPAIKEILEKELVKFDSISMREKTSAEYLSRLTNCEIETVLDPVMLLNCEEWDRTVADCDEQQGAYIFYYSVGADKKHRKIIDVLQRRYNLPIRQLGYCGGEQFGPKEFIGLIKNAKYVVTDSFHATVLSILYHKDFVVFPIDSIPTDRSKNARLQDLLTAFELSERFVGLCSEETIEGRVIKILDDNIEYETVDLILLNQRCKSIGFLQDSLRKERTKQMPVKSSECCGCGVCSLLCPVGAITMEKQELGFAFPVVDKDKCIACGKCIEVCNRKYSSEENAQVVGLQSVDDKVREKSSSGGAFYELACQILQNDGIVAACRFDEKQRAIHDFCFSVDELDLFCRSKYVQSDAYRLFAQIKQYLNDKRTILFVGTPCQVSALNSYLDKEYENLYLVDLICGGVGAPELWDKYVEYKQDFGDIQSVSMREKFTGYLNPEGFPNLAMRINYADGVEVHPGTEDYYLRSRLNYYRESCYDCRYKGKNRASDVTIGDFVGMNNSFSDMYDAKGTSLTIVRTSKGKTLLEKSSNRLDIIEIPSDYLENVLADNPMYSKQMKRKPQYYYMRAICNNSSIERIYHEDRYWDEFEKNELILKNFFNEIKRNDLMLKVERAIRYHLWLDESPIMTGNIYIYGAGKLGRSLIKCIHEVKGFVDCNLKLNSCEGIQVFHMGTNLLKEELGTGKNATLIVTPVWDYEMIAERVKSDFSDINVVSASELVGNIWI